MGRDHREHRRWPGCAGCHARLSTGQRSRASSRSITTGRGGIRLGPEPIVPFPTDMGISLPNLTNVSGSGPLRLSICWHRRADWLASTAVI